MTIKDHLKRKRREQRLTLDDVAAVVGVSRQTVQKYESGVISNIPPEKVELLAKALKTTPSVLMGWQEDVLDPFTVKGILPVRQRRVPLLGDIAAGEPIFAQEDHDSYALCDDDLRCDFALRVKGDSMLPRLMEGDTVFVRRQEDVLDGQIAAVLVDDSATLKHVYHLPGIGGLQLISDNTAYAPMVYAGADAFSVRVLGLAVAYQRKLWKDF